MSTQTSPIRTTRPHEICIGFTNTLRKDLLAILIPLLKTGIGSLPKSYTIELRLNSSDDGVTLRMTNEEEVL